MAEDAYALIKKLKLRKPARARLVDGRDGRPGPRRLPPEHAGIDRPVRHRHRRPRRRSRSRQEMLERLAPAHTQDDLWDLNFTSRSAYRAYKKRLTKRRTCRASAPRPRLAQFLATGPFVAESEHADLGRAPAPEGADPRGERYARHSAAGGQHPAPRRPHPARDAGAIPRPRSTRSCSRSRPRSLADRRLPPTRPLTRPGGKEPPTIAEVIGGPWGLVESAAPAVAFVVAYTVSGQDTTLSAIVAVAFGVITFITRVDPARVAAQLDLRPRRRAVRRVHRHAQRQGRGLLPPGPAAQHRRTRPRSSSRW